MLLLFLSTDPAFCKMLSKPFQGTLPVNLPAQMHLWAAQSWIVPHAPASWTKFNTLPSALHEHDLYILCHGNCLSRWGTIFLHIFCS